MQSQKRMAKGIGGWEKHLVSRVRGGKARINRTVDNSFHDWFLSVFWNRLKVLCKGRSKVIRRERFMSRASTGTHSKNKKEYIYHNDKWEWGM